MKIGIDLGNVIIGGSGADTQFFTEDYLKTPELEGSWAALSSLRKTHELHIISKCGPVTEEKSLKWLKSHGFTEILRGHRLYFVRKRELKAPMAQALQLDIFIDDREDVLVHMEGIVKHRILFKSWEQANKELEKIFASNG